MTFESCWSYDEGEMKNQKTCEKFFTDEQHIFENDIFAFDNGDFIKITEGNTVPPTSNLSVHIGSENEANGSMVRMRIGKKCIWKFCEFFLQVIFNYNL